MFKNIQIKDDIPLLVPNEHYSFFKKVIIFISLNGHLLPLSMLDKNEYYIDKFNENNIISMFFKKHVIVYDNVNKVGYRLSRNCCYFFKNILLMSFYTVVFLVKYIFVKNKYRKFYKKLKNGTFWRSLYKHS